MLCVRDFVIILTRNSQSAFFTSDTDDLVLANLIKNAIESTELPNKWQPMSHCVEKDHSYMQVKHKQRDTNALNYLFNNSLW